MAAVTLPFFYAKSGVEGFTFSRIAAHLEGFIRKKESMMWYQQTLTLGPKSRGFHLVTDEILGQIRGLSGVKVGLLHLLLQHTSASLTLNENCDPTVRYDMEQYFLNAVPDNAPYEHDYEGPDDMPSHIKSSMRGVSLMLPDEDGRVRLGTWQGIWLGEHRIHGCSRHIVATLMGE